MLRKDADKWEERTEVWLFMGYPKGTRGGLFYSPIDTKIVVNTNAKYLKEELKVESNPLSYDEDINNMDVD